jgi:hypothetical protein
MSALGLDVEPVLAFFAPIDSVRYVDFDADGGGTMLSLYDALFRNKAVLNPPDAAFTLEPSMLIGTLSAHTDALVAAFQITSADYARLVDVNAGIVVADTRRRQPERVPAYHVARAAGVSIPDYLTPGDPWSRSVRIRRAMPRSSRACSSNGGVFSIAQLDTSCATTSWRTPPWLRPPAPSRCSSRLRTDLAKVLPKDRRHDCAGDRRRQPCRRQRAPQSGEAHVFRDAISPP